MFCVPSQPMESAGGSWVPLCALTEDDGTCPRPSRLSPFDLFEQLGGGKIFGAFLFYFNNVLKDCQHRRR